MLNQVKFLLKKKETKYIIQMLFVVFGLSFVSWLFHGEPFLWWIVGIPSAVVIFVGGVDIFLNVRRLWRRPIRQIPIRW
ncbi:MAG: hypothetical protein KKA64_02700 [Nanoarchaeota archaeon]|nr:hypothetical protein [Nanoarchaeota archaeon]